jgi:hypothetical protein
MGVVVTLVSPGAVVPNDEQVDRRRDGADRPPDVTDEGESRAVG